MRASTIALIGAAILTLPGCIAKTALNAVTAPVRIASKTVDLATTSQSEADEKRGRELRQREGRLGQLERSWQEMNRNCLDGKDSACAERDALVQEIDQLRSTIPARYSD